MIVFGWVLFCLLCCVLLLNVSAMVGSKDLATRIGQFVAFAINIAVALFIWLTIR